MTLNNKTLKKLSESMKVCFSKEQEVIILQRFGTEPFPYEWSEQDIVEQIHRLLHQHPRLVIISDALKREVLQ